MTTDYLTRKNPFYALLIFSLPMIVGNLFQQTYTMADSAIAGRFVGERALAAIGASYSLTNIFICIAMGGAIGASVIISQYFGAKDLVKMKAVINTSLLSFLIISILLSAVGLIFSRNIMIILNTPIDALDMAVEYLTIYFYSLPFLFMYNVLSSIFNALGKSKIPLAFLIFSSLFNIILDWILVTTFQMGIAGLAWATLIAQGISALLSFLVLSAQLKTIDSNNHTIFAREELLPMSKIALPSILQQSTVSIGMMLVQSVVNGFGSEVLAGFSAAMRVETMCVVPMAGIGNAISSYTAQNIGAGKKQRVIKGYHAANGMIIICAAIICFILEFFHNPIIEMFLGKTATMSALATGNNYLMFMGWCFCLIGFKMAVDGLLCGAGDMKMFTLANFVNLIIRVSLAMTLAPQFGIAVVWCAVPIGWLANWAISFVQYRTGKWQSKLVINSSFEKLKQ